MRTLEQIYGSEKASAIEEAVRNGHLRTSVGKVNVSAEKAKTAENIEEEYARVDILDEAGGLVLYGSMAKLLADATYAYDLGVRSKIRQNVLSKVEDPEKDLRKMATLAVKTGMFPDEATALASLRALKTHA